MMKHVYSQLFETSTRVCCKRTEREMKLESKDVYVFCGKIQSISQWESYCSVSFDPRMAVACANCWALVW